MADDYIRMPTDGNGKALQTYRNTVSSTEVHSEAITLTSADGAALTTDDVDDVLVTIDFVHHEIHEGNHYTASIYDNDVDIVGPKYVRITTPATGETHLVFSVSGSAGFIAEFYEDPTLNAAGAAVARINNNRVSTNTANVTTFQDTTTQAPNNDGTLLWSAIAGSGGNPAQSNSGQSGARQEFILTTSEDYLVKVTVLADNTKINIQAEWYEA